MPLKEIANLNDSLYGYIYLLISHFYLDESLLSLPAANEYLSSTFRSILTKAVEFELHDLATMFVA